MKIETKLALNNIKKNSCYQLFLNLFYGIILLE